VYTTEELGGPKLAPLYRFAGKAEPLGKGLYWVSPDGSYGETKPTDMQILSVLLRGKEFLVTGNARWDLLSLGVTRPLGVTLVYTMRRAGEYMIGGRRFRLVRIYKSQRRFPTAPVYEWWIVDLLENLEATGLQRDDVLERVSAGLVDGRFNREVLVDQATTWATPGVVRMVSAALAGAQMPRTGLRRETGLPATSTGPRARRKRQQVTEDKRDDAPTTR
jgi:hypothetical protein